MLLLKQKKLFYVYFRQRLFKTFFCFSLQGAKKLHFFSFGGDITMENVIARRKKGKKKILIKGK